MTQKLLKNSSVEECVLINEVLERYTYDGLTLGPKHLNFQYILICLNDMHRVIKYTFKMTKLMVSDHWQPYQALKILDIDGILYSDYTVETEMYNKLNKGTNKYGTITFTYKSAHPKNCLGNVPCRNFFIQLNMQEPLNIKRMSKISSCFIQ